MSEDVRMTAPETACELIKLLRAAWMDRPTIAAALGVSQHTSDRWVSEYARQGLLVERPSSRRPPRGIAPGEFTLAPEWGGQG